MYPIQSVICRLTSYYPHYFSAFSISPSIKCVTVSSFSTNRMRGSKRSTYFNIVEKCAFFPTA